MKKTFYIYQRPTNDVVINIQYSNDNSVRFVFAFNSISQTYFGFEIHSFLDSFRYFVIEYPSFLADSCNFISTKDLEAWLLEHEFTQVGITEFQKTIEDLIKFQ